MVLIASAQYLPAEFQVEIGKIPPAFLPFGGKRFYEYQKTLFDGLGEKVVLSLPQSFKVEKADWNKLEYLGIEVLFVPDNLSLGESILYCLNMNLPSKETIRILHGDTYFDSLEFGINSLVVSRVANNYDWAYLDLNFQMSNKDFVVKKDYVFSGYLEISDVYFFIQSLIKSQYNFIAGIKLYSNQYPLQVIENETWKDFGLLSSYFHFKQAITTKRAFNQLTLQEGYCHKSSSMDSKILGEIEWFESFPRHLDLHIPRFHLVDSTSYKVEYLYLNTLSELFVFGRLPTFVWKDIFEQIKAFLEKLHSLKTDKKVNFDYLGKTHQRLQNFLREYGFTMESLWRIGDLKVSLAQIIKETHSYIAPPPIFSFIHGDFCFSNIMYDFKSNHLKTFDPRGLDFSGKVTQFGDSRYDIAKLMHSCIGLYDFIIAGNFQCSIQEGVIELDILSPSSILPIQEVFLEVFCPHNKKEFYAIVIHLFLSMLPLHADNKPRAQALFANAFRLYSDFCKLKEDK